MGEPARDPRVTENQIPTRNSGAGGEGTQGERGGKGRGTVGGGGGERYYVEGCMKIRFD